MPFQFRLFPGLVACGISLVFGQPSGVQTGPFDEGSPYARLSDGASGLSAPSIRPEYHPSANPLSGSGSLDPFTGQSGFAIPLGSIGVRERVSYPVALTYSGNTRLPARDDNLTSPSSWLGLGWNMEAPSISRHHKSTYFT